MNVFKKLKDLVVPSVVSMSAEELLLWLQSASVSPSFFSKITWDGVTYYVGHPASILPKNYIATNLQLFLNPRDKICYIGNHMMYNGTFFDCVKLKSDRIYYAPITEDVLLDSPITVFGCTYAIGTVSMEEFESLYKSDLLRKEAEANAKSNDVDNISLSAKYKTV